MEASLCIHIMESSFCYNNNSPKPTRSRFRLSDGKCSVVLCVCVYGDDANGDGLRYHGDAQFRAVCVAIRNWREGNGCVSISPCECRCVILNAIGLFKVGE